MNILFTVGTLQSGGAERVVSILANMLAEKGNEVEIVLNNYQSESAYFIKNNVKISNIHSKKILGKNFFHYCYQLRKKIKYEKYDVVISFLWANNIKTIISSLGLKTPVIVSERINPYMAPSKKLMRGIRNLIYLLADGYVLQTQQMKEYFGRKVNRIGVVIANPIDTKRLPEYFVGERKKEIVAVNRLNEQKNIPMLIEAFDSISKKHPDYILNIYGEGTERNYLEGLINSLGLSEKIFLCGSKKNVLELINDSSLFILSSNFEGMPNALIEAMCLGLPCISTDSPIGGSAMLIENKANGLLIPVGDKEALINAINYMLENPEKANEMGKNAINTREILAVDVIVTKWENYIDKIISRS